MARLPFKGRLHGRTAHHSIIVSRAAALHGDQKLVAGSARLPDEQESHIPLPFQPSHDTRLPFFNALIASPKSISFSSGSLPSIIARAVGDYCRVQ
jgi:hypothetical protein